MCKKTKPYMLPVMYMYVVHVCHVCMFEKGLGRSAQAPFSSFFQFLTHQSTVWCGILKTPKIGKEPSCIHTCISIVPSVEVSQLINETKLSSKSNINDGCVNYKRLESVRTYAVHVFHVHTCTCTVHVHVPVAGST